MSIQCKEL